MLTLNEGIPFCDLTRALRPLREEISQAIGRVVDHGWFLRGPETRQFEEEWAYCGHAYCVVCNSGTDALTLAAKALELREAEIQATTVSLSFLGTDAWSSSVLSLPCFPGLQEDEIARVCDVIRDFSLSEAAIIRGGVSSA